MGISLKKEFSISLASKEDVLDLPINPSWVRTLDLIEESKLAWTDLTPFISIEGHPLKRVVSTKGKNTLLHLAILFKKEEIVSLLFEDSLMKKKRNQLGFTPSELALFLSSKKGFNFFSQEHLKIFSKDSLFSELEFVKNPVFDSYEILEEVLAFTKKAKKEDRIPQERVWLGAYFNLELEKGVHPLVSIQFINDEVGFGVFAGQKIPACSYVGEYTGVIKRRDAKKIKNEIYSVRYSIWDLLKKKYVLDAKEKGNFTRFINHSKTPNLSLQSVYWRGIPRMVFVSLRKISLGEQLSFDYGTFFWKETKEIPELL